MCIRDRPRTTAVASMTSHWRSTSPGFGVYVRTDYASFSRDFTALVISQRLYSQAIMWCASSSDRDPVIGTPQLEAHDQQVAVRTTRYNDTGVQAHRIISAHRLL